MLPHPNLDPNLYQITRFLVNLLPIILSETIDERAWICEIFGNFATSGFYTTFPLFCLREGNTLVTAVYFFLAWSVRCTSPFSLGIISPPLLFDRAPQGRCNLAESECELQILEALFHDQLCVPVATFESSTFTFANTLLLCWSWSLENIYPHYLFPCLVYLVSLSGGWLEGCGGVEARVRESSPWIPKHCLGSMVT